MLVFVYFFKAGYCNGYAYSLIWTIVVLFLLLTVIVILVEANSFRDSVYA